MKHPHRATRSIIALLAPLALPAIALAQATPGAAPPTPTEIERHSALQFVLGGGVVGWIIIALSVVAVALVIDLLLRVKRDRTFPESLVRHAMELAEQGRASELLSMSKASDTMFGRIVGGALDRGRYGIEVVRQEVQQLGEKEIFRLRNRVAQIGVIATAGPMLGLLGTVIGMINSFSVLGASKNAARPDELASGISLALITTCQGLILAVPLIFVHMYLRDRVSQTSQDMAHIAEKLLGLLATGTANRQRAMAQQQPHGAPQHVPQASYGARPPQMSGQVAPMPPAPPPPGLPPIGSAPLGTHGS